MSLNDCTALVSLHACPHWSFFECRSGFSDMAPCLLDPEYGSRLGSCGAQTDQELMSHPLRVAPGDLKQDDGVLDSMNH